MFLWKGRPLEELSREELLEALCCVLNSTLMGGTEFVDSEVIELQRGEDGVWG